MKQKYIILRQDLPSELNVKQVRQIIADYYKLSPDEVIMNCVTHDDTVCLIRTQVKDKEGKAIGVRG